MNEVRIELPESLKISGIEAVWSSIGPAVELGEPIVLDGAAVSVVDYAALQMLGAAAHYAAGSGGQVVLREPSDVLAASLALAGLQVQQGG